MSVFAKRLKEARIRAGLSQEQLGLEAGLDPMSASTRMNRYELAKRAPSYDLVERIAEVLNLPVTYFFAPEADIAELLVLFHKMSSSDKARLLELARSVSR